MGAYTKAEFISDVAKAAGISKPKAKLAIEAAVAKACEKVGENGEFSFPGICKIEKVHRNARRVRNPATGAYLMVGEHDVIRVRPLKRLRDILPPPPRPVPINAVPVPEPEPAAEQAPVIEPTPAPVAEAAPAVEAAVAAAAEPVAVEQPAEQPVSEAPVAEAPVAEAPAPEEAPVVEQPAPAYEEPAPAEEAAAEQPVAEAPAEEAPVAEATAAEAPVGEPPAEQPVYEQPVAEQAAYEQPAAEAPAEQQYAQATGALISFRCKNPECMQEIEATDDMSGQIAACPTCGAEVQIPYFSEPGTLHGPAIQQEDVAAAVGRTIRIDLSDDDLM